MVYSQFRTLISIVIVLALAVAFLWGGNRVLSSVTGSAAPAPTPTVKPVVEPPTAAPTAPGKKPLPTPAHKRPTSAARQPTPKPAAHHPRSTPTPHTPPKVLMTASNTANNPATVFHVNPTVNRFYCWVRNSALPPGTSAVTFNWVEEKPTNQFLTQYPVSLQSGTFTGGFYQGYITQTPGAYRCDVIINGQTFGTAHFTVTP